MPETIRVNRIPALLTDAPQWLVWRYEERDGKTTKPPYQVNGKLASHSNPETWTNFQRALTAYHNGGWSGIGFVLSDVDPIGGIDLDHCVDPDTGEVADWAAEIIERVGSYAEISPSGTGVRIFVQATLPASSPRGGRKRTGMGLDAAGAVEMYCRLRYLTVTGRHLASTPDDVRECNEAFHALYHELFPEKVKPEPRASTGGSPLSLDDHELQQRMFTARNGIDILRLWNGDLSGNNGDHSAADLALCNSLAFWCNGDLAQMDRLFRQSRLMRDKWDELRGDQTYGQMTLGMAAAEAREGFTPSQRFEIEEMPAALSPERQDELEAARALVPELPARLKEDPGFPFTDEGRRALGLLQALDKAAWARAKSALQKARVSVRDLLTVLPKPSEFLPKPDGPAAGEGSRHAGDTLPDCPAPALIIPNPFYVEPGVTGRWVPDEKSGEMRKAPFAYAPVLITGRTQDVTTGDESLLLAWRWPNSGWRSRIIDRSSALEKRKLLGLALAGFPVGDDNTRDLVSYIHRLDAANRPALPCARVSSHLGWQGEPGAAPFLCGRSLILPNGAIEAVNALDIENPEEWSDNRICFHGTGEGQDQIVDAFYTNGTFDGWLKAVRPLKDFPKPLIVFYAGFAAPLLQIFGVNNFIVDLAHDTTVGKTTALRAAASCWGNPDEKSACSVVQTWDASRVGVERVSEVLGCLPLFVDDTKKAKTPRMVADLIYAVHSGRGRVRGTIRGLAHTPVWRTVMFSTGEQPATSFTQDGGTRTRVLSIGGMPFGGQTLELGRLTAALNAQLYLNFGHAGPRFISWLQQNRASWPEWIERHAQLTTGYAEAAHSPEAGRLAPYAALITISGEMAHKALGLPWAFTDPVRELWGDLAAEAGDAAGSVRALEDVLSWASSHEARFIGRHQHNGFFERVPPEIYGRWDEGESWEYLAIYPTVLNRTLTDLGFSPDGIKRSWRERGWLRHSSGKFTTDVPLGSGTAHKRMVCILREAFNALDSG